MLTNRTRSLTVRQLVKVVKKYSLILFALFRFVGVAGWRKSLTTAPEEKSSTEKVSKNEVGDSGPSLEELSKQIEALSEEKKSFEVYFLTFL